MWGDPPSDAVDVFEESLRQVERIIDGQLAAIQRQGEAATQLVRLSLAAMAGQIAGLGIVTSIGLPLGPVAVACLAMGFALMVMAAAYLAGIAIGGRDPGEGILGPSPRAVWRQLANPDWTSKALRASLVEEGAHASAFNTDVLLAWSRHRRRGHALLVAAVAITLLGFALITGGSII